MFFSWKRVSAAFSTRPRHEHDETKAIIRDFLDKSSYKSPKSPIDDALHSELAVELAAWPEDVAPAFREKVVDGACTLAETTYGHTTHAHRAYIALYTACLMYVDDLGARRDRLDAVMRFTGRFVRGEQQPDPVLERLAELLKTRTHELWNACSADAIVAGTLDAVAAMYVEHSTQDTLVIVPQATRFPYYLRTRAGIGPPYIHFAFMGEWRETPDSYLQVIPYMEHWTLGNNDILSFYKEELAGETKNYVHLRAAAEQCSAPDVLRRLVDEVLESARRMQALTASDPELAELWRRYSQGYLEFGLKAKRYRLAELGYEP